MKHVFVIETSNKMDGDTHKLIMDMISDLYGLNSMIVCSRINQPDGTALLVPNALHGDAYIIRSE